MGSVVGGIAVDAVSFPLELKFLESGVLAKIVLNMPVLVYFSLSQSVLPLFISMCASSAREAVEGIVMLASMIVASGIELVVLLFLKSEGKSFPLKLTNFAVWLQERVGCGAGPAGLLSSSFRLRMSGFIVIIVILLLAVVGLSLVITKGGSSVSFAWLPF